MHPQQFVAKWSAAALKESASVKEHFIDLCRLAGHPTPAEDDPTGERFTFEAGVSKTGGGHGFADVWKKGYFAWEYKGKDGDLDRAYLQLLRYREDLQNPPLLIVSNIDAIVIHPNFVNAKNDPITITLGDLLTPAGRAKLHAIFFDPFSLQVARPTPNVTEEAARQFSQLAALLRGHGHANQTVAHFLIRLLFCLFAEDCGLLPNRVFSRLAEGGRHVPAAYNAQLRQLFAAMATGGYFGVENIPYFDGGLFDGDATLDLDSAAIGLLYQVSNLDWSSIEPSIFGTLFERSLDPAKRSQLGAHYTSRDDILLIVEPVLMAPLRREWAAVQEEARRLAQERDAAGRTQTRLRDNRNAELRSLLQGFAERLASVRVLDPACGSGNFLYVALRQLLELEHEASLFGAELGLPRAIPRVNPSWLYGIEVNEYAHELAQTTVQIGYLQWFNEHGYGWPEEPILCVRATIHHMDAILAYDAAGNPVEPEWPEADVIIGNPPFLGGKLLRTGLGDSCVDGLFTLYRNRVPHECDLVCYWFEKARSQVEKGAAQRAGLLATQGIRGGANRRILDRIKRSGDIFYAQSDRDWVLDGAVVHVSMVGFDRGGELIRELDGRPVNVIYSNLTSQVDATAVKRLPENSGLSFMGVTPAGPFDVSESQALGWIRQQGNPNGRANSEVLRPYFNGLDIGQRPRGVWIVDFGVDMSLVEAAEFEAPFEYVRSVVRPLRAKNNRKAYRDRWWILAEPRPAMRKAFSGLHRYIGTSMVSKHHIFAWIPARVLPANLLIVIAREDDYFFGMVHSRVHELWSRCMGTQLREAESGQRYTPTTTFETFPFPWPPGHEPADDPRVAAIAAAAQELHAKRDTWLNPPGASEAELKKRTLTNLYNDRPMWLQLAHTKLDAAVAAAYGWPADLADDAILARLLALNLERAAKA
jgi:type II restriction/modification system DNA methylase subunit YeeA